MAIGCGPKCARIVLIVFNVIFWLSGAAILAIGVWFRVDKNILEMIAFTSVDKSDPMLNHAAYILIAVGVFVFVVGFLGCCGAIQESSCMLGLYIGLLVVVMAGELTAGILAMLYKNEVKRTLGASVKRKLQKDELTSNNGTVYTAFAQFLMFAQYSFKCCGVESALDYNTSGRGGMFVLPTCCKMASTFNGDPRKAVRESVAEWQVCQDEAKDAMVQQKLPPASDDRQLHIDGCANKLIAWIDRKALILIGIGIGVASLEVFGIVFAICLCRNFGKEEPETE